jgi:hypothetical protein
VFWGLDTGVPLTTIRVSALPALGVILIASGLGPPWAGLVYGTVLAAGVALGTLVASRSRLLERQLAVAHRLGSPAALVGPTLVVLAVLMFQVRR